MLKMGWLEDHLRSIEGAVETIEMLHWDLDIHEGTNGNWFVYSGDQMVLHTDSRETLDAFLYGMALAYNPGIPSPYFEELVEKMDEWYKDLYPHLYEDEDSSPSD